MLAVLGPVKGLSLQNLEVNEQERGRELLRLLLQGHINSRGDVGEPIEIIDPKLTEKSHGVTKWLDRQKGSEKGIGGHWGALIRNCARDRERGMGAEVA